MGHGFPWMPRIHTDIPCGKPYKSVLIRVLTLGDILAQV